MVPRPLAPAQTMRSRTCAHVIQHDWVAISSPFVFLASGDRTPETLDKIAVQEPSNKAKRAALRRLDVQNSHIFDLCSQSVAFPHCWPKEFEIVSEHADVRRVTAAAIADSPFNSDSCELTRQSWDGIVYVAVISKSMLLCVCSVIYHR